MLLWEFKWGFESDFVYVARPGPEYWEVEEDTSQVIFLALLFAAIVSLVRT